MTRTGCNHKEDTFKCCVAALLELHNREIEAPGALEGALAGRGLAQMRAAIDVNDLRPYRAFGYWLLSGPGGTVVMLGDSLAFNPLHADVWAPSAIGPGQGIATFLVPFNPQFVRAHKRPPQ